MSLPSMSEAEVAELAYGPDSLIDFFGGDAALSELLTNVELAILESEKLNGGAERDDEDANKLLIFVTTGAWAQLYARFSRAVDLLHSEEKSAWEYLGWDSKAFSAAEEFGEYLARIALDFVVLHELAHVARGHVDRYIRQTGQSLTEVSADVGSPLTAVRLQALELDADSMALYFFITLGEPILQESPRYKRMPSIKIYVAALGFCVRVVFALFTEAERVFLAPTAAPSLRDVHSGRRHPLPVIRDVFADRRLHQLASGEEETAIFSEATQASEDTFVQVMEKGGFEASIMAAYARYSDEEIEEYANLLIDDVALAAKEGWMNDSRLEKSLRAVRPD